MRNSNECLSSLEQPLSHGFDIRFTTHVTVITNTLTLNGGVAQFREAYALGYLEYYAAHINLWRFQSSRNIHHSNSTSRDFNRNASVHRS